MVVVGVSGGVDTGRLLVMFPVGDTKALNVMSVGIDVLTEIVVLALRVPSRSEPVDPDKVELCEPVGEVVPFGCEGSVVVNEGEWVEDLVVALVEELLFRCEDDIVEDVA